MRIFHSSGSKERLFEMMKRVNGLNEGILSIDKRNDVVNDFISFANNMLNLNDYPDVNLIDDEDVAKLMHSYGRYMPETDEIVVVAANRGLADILRTIVHELVHHKQRQENRLNPNSGETGSSEENEANAIAGIIMREYAKNNPIIFE